MFIIAIQTMCPSALISILMTGITHLICCAQWEKNKINHSFQGQTSEFAKCDCFVHVNKITFCFDSTSTVICNVFTVHITVMMTYQFAPFV